MGILTSFFKGTMKMVIASIVLTIIMFLAYKILKEFDNGNFHNGDQENWNKRIKKFFLGIILNFFLLCVPMIFMFILGVQPYQVKQDWGASLLGFWGATIGAIIGITGVWWQVNRTRDNTKELKFSQGRPFFIITVRKEMFLKNKLYVAKGHEYQKEVEKKISKNIRHKNYENILSINNVSNKDMYAVKVLLEKDDNTVVRFHINSVAKHSEINILDTDLEKDINCILKIKIYYVTELRERIKLVFSNNGGNITYLKKERMIENHGKKVDETEYKSSGFSGNYIYVVRHCLTERTGN